MKQQNDNKKHLILDMLLPLCKDKSGNFDTKKTDDCKNMVKNFGIFAMVIGTILLLVGFIGMVIKQTALSTDVLWFWVAVIFGTIFTCVGISAINLSTNVNTYVKNKLNPQTDEQD